MTLPKTITLDTDRLYLDEVTPELFSYIMTNYTDEQIKERLCYTDEDLAIAKARFPKGITYYGITFKYFILIDKETNKSIGTCGFYRWYPEHNRGEFGYVMSDESYREKGLMREAATILIEYGFREMNLHRIEAFASPTNQPSVKILEGLGLKYEGLLKEHFLKNGVYEDSACYAILKKEYLNNHK